MLNLFVEKYPNNKSELYFNDELKNYDNQAFCIYKSLEGRVYVGRSTGLYWFNGGKQEKVKELKNNPVFSISTDNQGRLAIGTANKIIILNSNYKIEKEYYPKFKAAKTLLVSGEKNINKLILILKGKRNAVLSSLKKDQASFRYFLLEYRS